MLLGTSELTTLGNKYMKGGGDISITDVGEDLNFSIGKINIFFNVASNNCQCCHFRYPPISLLAIRYFVVPKGVLVFTYIFSGEFVRLQLKHRQCLLLFANRQYKQNVRYWQNEKQELFDAF